MILIDKYVKFLTKHKITEKQLLILLLIYYKRKDLNDLYKQAFNIEGHIASEKDKEVLRSKKFIVQDEYGRETLSKEFLSIFIDKDIATDEIFELYPTSMIMNGVPIPLKAMDRSIFANLYIAAIMGSVEEHEEVKKDLEFAVKRKLLSIGIEKFIKSKYWLGLRKERLANKEVIETKTTIDYNF